MHRSHRAQERGIEGEDAAVGSHQPVAPCPVVDGHPHDGPVESEGTGRAIEPSITEGEDAAIGGHQVIAVP